MIRTLFLVSLFLWVAAPAPAQGKCASPLTTEKTIVIDQYPGPLSSYWLKQQLADKEIVITFDDGPMAGSTEKILDILKAECIKAGFFLMGQNVEAHPGLVRRIADEGHIVGYHSWSHKRFTLISVPEVEEEIARGILAVEKVVPADFAFSNFFRFPHLSHDPSSDRLVASHGLVAIGGDFMVPDWTDIPPQQIHDLMMALIREKGKGVMILHDVHDRTAQALPLILKSLKKEGYKTVQLVPAPTSQTAPGGP